MIRAVKELVQSYPAGKWHSRTLSISYTWKRPTVMTPTAEPRNSDTIYSEMPLFFIPQL